MIGGDPAINAARLLNDVLGLTIIAVMLCSQARWLRRVGLAFLILGGLDGIVRYVGNFSTITVFEACYQVPWIAVGGLAILWWSDPPRIHAAELIDRYL